MERSAQIGLVRELVASSVGRPARAVSPLAGGQVGRVFRADADTASYLVKLVESSPSPDFEDEPAEDRVYGARFDNLRPAYALLRQAGLPTPRLYGCGALPEHGLAYAVFDYLDGDQDDFSPAWFSAVGQSLRALHAVTRPYQGWIGMPTALPEPWPAAVERALWTNYARAEPHLPRSLAAAVERRARRVARLDEPAEFVLSHTDGFQGVLKSAGGAWALLGHIDVEDFQFTDRRFVLTGFQLAHRLSGRTVPQTFWRAYGPPPAGDPLPFELLYLLVWTRVLRNVPAALAVCLAELARIVG